MVGLPLLGDGIVIDRLGPEDAAALAGSHSDADNARYQNWTFPLPEAAAGALIAECATVEPLAPGSALQLAVRDEPGGPFVGDVFVERLAAEPWIVEVGITLAPGAGGQGRARRAMVAVIDAAFAAEHPTHGRVHRVTARVDVDNERSLRLFDELGLCREARLRWSNRSRGGELRDEIVFAATSERWRRSTAELEIVDDPHPADLAALEEQLYRFNVAATGYTDGELAACFVRDEDGRLRAGISGWTWGGVGEISLLWVAEQRRSSGVGGALVAAFEAEARRRGARRLVVSTHTFQAPGFYARLGFEEVARIESPLGHGDLLLVKSLD